MNSGKWLFFGRNIKGIISRSYDGERIDVIDFRGEHELVPERNK